MAENDLWGGACPPIQIIARFATLGPAALMASQCVHAYVARGNVQRLTATHAPLLHKSLGGLSSDESRTSPIVVFDIDDTLLSEVTGKVQPIESAIQLFNQLQSAGAYSVLVTARLNDTSMQRMTASSLQKIGIRDWKELHLAPASARRSMTAVSKWKHSIRAAAARRMKQPVVLSVGDQWGDLLPLGADEDIDDMDEAFGVREPYQLVRPQDGYTLWGLKLKSLN
jgi:hypothetical protein